MVHVPWLYLLLALFSGAESLRLTKNNKADKAKTNRTDVVRPRRTVFALGGGDNFMMTKLLETNTRLSTIEGTLFRIENILNFLQAGGGVPLAHVASIVKTPLVAGHASVPGADATALPIASGAGTAALPSASGAGAAALPSASGAGAAALPASRSAQGGASFPQEIHHGLQPPQARNNMIGSLIALAQPGSAMAQVASQPKKVHWMDSTCSEPCGIANGPKAEPEPVAPAGRSTPVDPDAIDVTNMRVVAAARVARDAAQQNGSLPANDDLDPIEVNQMRVVEKRSQESRRPRILGGEESHKHKYPWQVYIQIYHTVGRTARCGGAIINDRYVITAAHCTYTGNKACETKVQPEDVSVTVAEHNINSINDDVGGVTDRIDVKRIIRHPKFCSTNIQMDSDIALLRLAEILVLPDIAEIGYICLPGSPLEDFSGMTATLTGWGYKEEDYDERSFSDLAVKLQEVDFKIHADCSGYPEPEDLTDNMFCAGDEDNLKDACGGDSGGPLIVQKDSQYTLAGIVSFGPEGGDCTGETIYVKVTNYLQWIRENTMDAGC